MGLTSGKGGNVVRLLADALDTRFRKLENIE